MIDHNIYLYEQKLTSRSSTGDSWLTSFGCSEQLLFDNKADFILTAYEKSLL